MAGDLIPPPSPAGKPTPDGQESGAAERREKDAAPAAGGLWSAVEPERDDVVVAAHPDDDAPAAAADPLRAAGPVPERFRARFGFLTGALVGTGVAALAISALLVLGGGGAPTSRGVDWSLWKPSADDTFGAAEEIADHVARKYRQGDGTQLVSVSAGEIAVQDIPLKVIVKTAAIGGDLVEIKGDGLQYTLNGLGERGSILGGKPSEARLALLKREALELALYTFRYIDGIDHVVTFLPPRPPATTTTPSATATPGSGTSSTAADETITAMLFRPGDLERQLENPVDLTINPVTPRPENMPRRDVLTITEFTARNMFTATVQQAQDRTAYLVLERPQGLVGGLPPVAGSPAAAGTATPTPTPTASASATKRKKRG